MPLQCNALFKVDPMKIGNSDIAGFEQGTSK